MDYKEKLSGWGNNINVNSSVYLPKNNIDESRTWLRSNGGYKNLKFNNDYFRLDFVCFTQFSKNIRITFSIFDLCNN